MQLHLHCSNVSFLVMIEAADEVTGRHLMQAMTPILSVRSCLPLLITNKVSWIVVNILVSNMLSSSIMVHHSSCFSSDIITLMSLLLAMTTMMGWVGWDLQHEP
jgi:predicted Kef-type K+ transport protein